MDPCKSGFLVVANRLPVTRTVRPAGWRTSPGGLIAALAPVVRAKHGAWVGWTGRTGKTAAPFCHDTMMLYPVALGRREIEGFYEGFANATLWPLFHDAVRAPQFVEAWWTAYRSANERFAEVTAARAAKGATVWVHDYHLMLLPRMLRDARPDLRIGYFHHIPFPPPELFRQLPWRDELMAGLAGADLVGFQTPEGARNYARSAGTGAARAGAFPISIDAEQWHTIAADPGVERRAAKLRSRLGKPRRVLLGVDRLDYTKGIDQRMQAFNELLIEGTLRAGDAVLVQIAVPTREDVSLYIEQRERIEKLVGEINGQHGSVGRPVIHYLYRSLDQDDLAALYRAADVMLVTPLADGMNLVAKEYVTCRVDDTGALVLSEFAGAARELTDALLVNPYDRAELKAAIMAAVDIEPTDASRRMAAMRRLVHRRDVHRWARSFLTALSGPSGPGPPAT